MPDRLEKTSLRLGLLPLADAAPLVIAKSHGFFARHGLDVELSVERAWAALRDKVAAGVLDGGQMLAPMPIAGPWTAATTGFGYDSSRSVMRAPAAPGAVAVWGEAVAKDSGWTTNIVKALAKAFKTQVNNSVVVPIFRALKRELKKRKWI